MPAATEAARRGDEVLQKVYGWKACLCAFKWAGGNNQHRFNKKRLAQTGLKMECCKQHRRERLSELHVRMGLRTSHDGTRKEEQGKHDPNACFPDTTICFVRCIMPNLRANNITAVRPQKSRLPSREAISSASLRQ